MCDLLHIDRETYYENIKGTIFGKLNQDANLLNAIEELGLLSEDLVDKMGNPLDSLALYMAKRLAYSKLKHLILLNYFFKKYCL